ncbi:hypothetical protein [Paenibacillus sp. FSL W8-0194]|uniref:hypothetical protein n=1 Tax=Paenibacillus sp. FSL W8-0194 TaxID=2921711 RepID=UPI0030DBD762
MYLNVPDWYFLNGSNKTGMGYREVNWDLPRERQLILGRQNIFDGTWKKTPSMGWMFVPPMPYHGGGAEAIFGTAFQTDPQTACRSNIPDERILI